MHSMKRIENGDGVLEDKKSGGNAFSVYSNLSKQLQYLGGSPLILVK